VPPGLQRSELRTSDGVRLSLLGGAPRRAGPALAERAVPTLVFVPGWCMPAWLWTAQLEALAPRWPVLALDPRGQGDSQIAAPGTTLDRRADDLHELIATLAGPVVLVGWSLGGIEALHYIHRHGSTRLQGLVLVDSSVGEPPAPPPSDFAAALRRDRRAAMERFVQAIFARPRPAEEQARLLEAALRLPLETSLALLDSGLPRTHWRAIVHALACPLAYCITPQYHEQSRRLLAARPATQVEVFEQAGHALFVDEAARFNRFLAGWVDALTASG